MAKRKQTMERARRKKKAEQQARAAEKVRRNTGRTAGPKPTGSSKAKEA